MMNLSKIAWELPSSKPILEKQDSTVEELKIIALQATRQNPLNNPFPYKVNEHLSAACKHTIEWANRFKLKNKKIIEKCVPDFVNLTSGAYPYCSAWRLKLISDWITFLFINDDTLEKKTTEKLIILNQRSIKILKNLEKPNKTDSNLTNALYDLAKRLKNAATEAWMSRFIRHVEEHLHSFLWEAKNRTLNIVPSLNEYIEWRRKTGAVFTTIALIEIAEKCEIPEPFFQKYLSPLMVACNDIICWSNDIKSSIKELEDGFINNLVFIYKNEHQCSLKEAVEGSIKMHNERISQFCVLKEALYSQMEMTPELSGYEGMIQKFVKGMGYWMGSHYVWANTSPRYNKIPINAKPLNAK